MQTAANIIVIVWWMLVLMTAWHAINSLINWITLKKLDISYIAASCVLDIYSYYTFNLLEDNNIIDAQPYLLTGSITESPCVHVCRDGMIT